MTEQTNTCHNCNNELIGNFCHHCGQKRGVPQITVKSLINDFTSKWFGWDNKFMRTVKFLTIAPGQTVRNYIDGNRVRYIGPLGYLFLMTAIMLLIYDLLGIDVADMIKESSNAFGLGAEFNEQQREFQQKVAEWNARFFRYTIMLLIPFSSLASYLLYTNSKRKYNYLENVALFFYLAGHAVWVSIIVVPILHFLGYGTALAVSVFGFIYTVYGIYYFHEKRGFGAVIRAALVYFVGFIFFVFTVGFMTIAILIVAIIFSKTAI